MQAPGKVHPLGVSPRNVQLQRFRYNCRSVDREVAPHPHDARAPHTVVDPTARHGGVSVRFGGWIKTEKFSKGLFRSIM